MSNPKRKEHTSRLRLCSDGREIKTFVVTVPKDRKNKNQTQATGALLTHKRSLNGKSLLKVWAADLIFRQVSE
jgi:hypothetical protein